MACKKKIFPKLFIFAAIFLSANYFRLQSIQQVINSIIASLVVVAVMARESTNDDQLVRLIDHNGENITMTSRQGNQKPPTTKQQL